MLVGCITTYAISTYHQQNYVFESSSGEVYLIQQSLSVACGRSVVKVSIATHISTFTEHDAEKSVTIDPMHTHCTPWYELYQIRIKRNK
jgi:uncharacterized protein YcfL